MSADSKIREEITITWRMENFSLHYHQKPGDIIISPSFGVENFHGSVYLLFYPRGKTFTDEYISCIFCGTDELDKGKVRNQKIDIITAGGDIFKSTKTKPIYFHGDPQNSNKLMKIDDLTKKMENCKEDTLIIRYYLTVDVTRKIPVTRYEIKTRVNVDRCSFQCNVANFNSEAWAETRTFLFLKTTRIEINLTAPGYGVLINIQKTEENPTVSRFATCRVSLLDIEGVERHLKKYTHLFDSKDYVGERRSAIWKFPFFITKTQKNLEGHTFLKNCTLTLLFEFSISSGTIDSEIHNKCDISSAVNAFPPTDTFSSLKDDLQSMFTSKKHSDVKLQVGGDTFPAHKSLLAARSPVFSTMFDQEMLESQTGIVNIPDMDAETMNSFLSFVYTGTVDKMDCEGTLKLLLAADKYQVDSLKEKCASVLKSDLSDGNACEVLVVADMVGHRLLKQFVQDYIKTRAGKILPSREWSQWVDKNVRLASEVLSKLSLHFGSLANR